MGWLHNWTTRKSDPRVSCRYLATSEDTHHHSSPLKRRKDKSNTKGNGGDRNRINGGRRGDNRAEDQGGGRDRGNGDNNNNNNGDNNNDNNNNGGKDNGGKNKPSDHSSLPGPPPSFTTTVVSVETPTTVVIPSPTFTSILTTTEISTLSTITTQTGEGFTLTSLTTSTNSVPASPSSPAVSSTSSVIPTTVLPTPPPTSSTQGSNPAISSSELSTGAKAGIAIAALSAFALVLGGIYLCWRRGAARTRATAGAQPETPGVQGSLVQGAMGMAQARRDSLGPNDHEGDPAPIHSASWRTTHPWRPPSAQSIRQTAAADSELLVPPAPAFQRPAQEMRRTMATWDTSSEPDSSAADRFSASALTTYLSPAPTRPRRLGGSTAV